ncbi:hypothetical protein O3M35_011389 [Rhynocoris fuscipes]|uniref:Peptidase A2 domain-containing protein n=1 Tax=Rhynocoris fuscipes TaxID=488301 RepID=A0AAW1CYC4_9HEMI
MMMGKNSDDIDKRNNDEYTDKRKNDNDTYKRKNDDDTNQRKNDDDTDERKNDDKIMIPYFSFIRRELSIRLFTQLCSQEKPLELATTNPFCIFQPSTNYLTFTCTFKRSTIFANVTSIFDAIKPLKVDNITKVQAYVSRLSYYEEKYRKVQSDIQEYNQFLPKEDRIDILSEESSFLGLVVEIESFYKKLEAQQVQPAPPTVATSLTPSSYMLPKIHLPSFSGKIEDWPDFISLYDSLVHLNASLDKIHKFQYLRSAVKGEALSLISGFQVSEANYLLAYQALVNRYQNKRRIASMYLNKILSFKSSNPPNSLANLRQLLNVHQTSVNAINALQIPNLADFLLFSLTLRNIDPLLRKKFEDQNTSNNIPSYEQLIKFITKQVRTLELNEGSEKPNTTFSKSKSTTQALTAAINSSKPQSSSNNPYSLICGFCKDKTHTIYTCDQFGRKSPREKYNWIKSQKLCVNCLRHPSKFTCHSKVTCSKCHHPHHSLLHFGSLPNTNNSNNNVFPQKPTNTTTTLTQPGTSSGSAEATHSPSSCVAGVSALTSTQFKTTTILMATCLVKLQVSPQNSIIVRALLDSGAGASFISERCAQLLQCSRSRTPIPICGIGHSQTKTKGSCFLSTLTLEGKLVSENHPFFIMESLTNNTPQVQISSAVRTATTQLRLADPSFDSPSPIDCILGADIAAIALEGGSPVVLGPNFPTAVPSVFGYILMGSAPRNPDSALIATPLGIFSTPPSVSSFYADPSSDLHLLLERFWSVEEPPKAITTFSHEDEFCETFFKETTTRAPSGRYQVRLPFLPSTTHTLGDSYNTAYARFTALERKFASNTEFKTQYCSFMDDYLQQGHMTLANGPKHYFIPHHGVFKSHGDTSKIRVVFNATSKTTTGYSLNDLLYAGPKLQPLLSDVISLFRQFLYVFVCDIRQMFRQIAIHPDDYPFQCILWRDDPSKPLQTYYLTTVTYSTRCAPYLFLRTILQLVEDEGINFPLAASSLKSNIFVDDIAVGANSLDQALLLRNEIISLLAKGNFLLRKWISNHSSLLEDIPQDHLLEPSTLVIQQFIPLLGTLWNPKDDTLSISVDITIPHNKTITKRIALSYISQIFDPCGWLTPFILRAKHFIQRLWFIPLDWDTPLSSELQNEFLTLFEDCSTLSKCSVPRPFSTNLNNSYILHGFCDASQIGYAAVLYLYSEPCTSKPVLLMAKSRVAPIKRMSIPCLELCSAHLLPSN